MGREVRMVPPGWEHPRKPNGEYRPLKDGRLFAGRLAEWDEEAAKWAEGLSRAYGGPDPWEPTPEKYRGMTYAEYAGDRPDANDYMLVGVPDGERTLYVMYEDTSEGTPISPAFETPEELARWLADTGASAFAGMGAAYGQWLATIRRGHAPSMVCEGGSIRSGVAYIAQTPNPNEQEQEQEP